MTDAKPGSDKITTLEPLLYRATFFVAFASLRGQDAGRHY